MFQLESPTSSIWTIFSCLIPSRHTHFSDNFWVSILSEISVPYMDHLLIPYSFSQIHLTMGQCFSCLGSSTSSTWTIFSCLVPSRHAHFDSYFWGQHSSKKLPSAVVSVWSHIVSTLLRVTSPIWSALTGPVH